MMRWIFAFMFMTTAAVAGAVKRIPLSADKSQFNTYITVKILNHTDVVEKVRVGDTNTRTIDPNGNHRERLTLATGKNYVVSNKAQCTLMAREPDSVFVIDVYQDSCTVTQLK